jgi:hypothetical protein
MPILTHAVKPIFVAFSMASSSDNNLRSAIQFVRVLLGCVSLAAF